MKHALAFLALLVPLTVQAAPLPRYGIFYYSNLCYSEQSGDAEQNRVLLIRDGDGDRLFWEYSDGPLEGPIQAKSVVIDRAGHIRFTVDIGSEYETANDLKGTITRAAPELVTQTGTVSDRAMMLGRARLPRVTNFAAKVPICR